MTMTTVLLFSLGIFSLSSLYFWLQPKKGANLPFLVSATTVISSLLMLEGSFITQNILGQDLYWTRWVFYTVSCTLLMLSIARLLKKDSAITMEMLYLTAFVMLTGAFGSAFDGIFKWGFFILGGIFYLQLLRKIFQGAKAKDTAYIIPFIFLGWTGFPLVFLLSPEGFSLISNPLAASTYLALDVYTKIYFYMRMKK